MNIDTIQEEDVTFHINFYTTDDTKNKNLEKYIHDDIEKDSLDYSIKDRIKKNLKYQKLNKVHSSNISPKKKFQNLNSMLFAIHSKSPTEAIKLTQSISRKVLFPPILRNHCITLSNRKAKYLLKSDVKDAVMNTETLNEDSWLNSRYLY